MALGVEYTKQRRMIHLNICAELIDLMEHVIGFIEYVTGWEISKWINDCKFWFEIMKYVINLYEDKQLLMFINVDLKSSFLSWF